MSIFHQSHCVNIGTSASTSDQASNIAVVLISRYMAKYTVL